MEKITRNYYLEILRHLQQYKVAMSDDRVWTVVSQHLGKLLGIVSIRLHEIRQSYLHLLERWTDKSRLTFALGKWRTRRGK